MAKHNKLERYIEEVDFFYSLNDEGNNIPIIADVDFTDLCLNSIGLSNQKGYTQITTPIKSQFVSTIN